MLSVILIALVALLTCALCLFAIQKSSSENTLQGEIGRLKVQIDSTQLELEVVLQRERQRFAMAAEAKGAAHLIAKASEDPQVRELATKLGRLVAHYQKRVGRAQMTADDALRIRVAEATIANANGDFSSAIKIIGNADVEAARRDTEFHVQREIDVNQVRADAFYGLRAFEMARPSYLRIIELRPGDVDAIVMAASCLLHTDQVEDAAR